MQSQMELIGLMESRELIEPVESRELMDEVLDVYIERNVA